MTHMRRRRTWTTQGLFAVLALTFGSAGVLRADPPLSEIVDATRPLSGVLVHVGAEDGSLAIAAAKQSPAIVLVLTPESNVEPLRKAVAAAGVAGQVTVLPRGATIPLIDGLAATVVLSDTSIVRPEAQRVLGARGRLIEPGKPAWVKPVPSGYDDWGQYFYNGAATDVSQDTALKPVSGVQWQAGTQDAGKLERTEQNTGLRVSGGILLHSTPTGLVARDARSGAPIWSRGDLHVADANRYAFLADAKLGRVWLLPHFTSDAANRAPGPRYLHMLDLATGKTLAQLDQGINFAMPDGYRMSHGENSRADDAQVRYADGKLLMMTKSDIAMLDAASGRKLWSNQAKAGEYWTPSLIDGVAYVVQGKRVRSMSYTHWPMGMVEAVVAFDAGTGKELWRTVPAVDGKSIAAYNLTVYRGKIALAVRWDNAPSNTPRGYLLVLDQKSGKQLTFIEVGGGDGLGKGHSHWRVMGIGDRWWLNGISSEKSVLIAAPEDKSQWKDSFGKLRPVECTVFRATPNYLIGAATLSAFDSGKIHMNTASRTGCDIGSFPADGLLFQGENSCWCRPYMIGLNAMNGAQWPAPPDGDRLVKHAAAPAAASAATDDQWPQYMQSPWRGNWNPAPLGGGQLKQAWTRPPEKSSAHALIRDEWNDLFMAQSRTVTGVSVAEGVAVYAMVHQGEVVAVDPASGKEKWRVGLQGRIDSQPTIHRGLVLVGTRTGWVHALNRDTGQLVWQFRAAPFEHLSAANGQLESVWPVSGAIAVTDAGAIVIAGRHSEIDGGLFWSVLDPMTGALKASGVWASELVESPRKGGGASVRKTVVTRNMPPVTDGKHVFLMDHLMVFDGKRMIPYTDGKSYDRNDITPAWIRTRDIPLVQPNLSTLAVGLPKRGYNKDAYAGMLSRQFIYRPGSASIIDMGGEGMGSYGGRGGGSESKVTLLKRLPAVAGEGNGRTGAEVVWSHPFSRELGELYGIRAAVAAADRVLVGLTYDGARDFRGKDRRMLVVLDYADGKTLQEIPLPAPPATGGISIAQGRVFVACEDGSIHCFTAR